MGVTEAVAEDELKFRLPFSLIISGASTSGKTSIMFRILENYRAMISPEPVEIVYCYTEFQEHTHRLELMGVTCYPNPPDDQLIDRLKKPALLIMDDCMNVVSERFLTDLFTRKVHHRALGLIYITQSLFEKNLRVARSNAQYILLTRAPSSQLGIRTLGSQIFPKQLQFFLDAYKLATENVPYGYLLVTLHPASDSRMRLRTNIMPGEVQCVFIPKHVE